MADPVPSIMPVVRKDEAARAAEERIRLGEQWRFVRNVGAIVIAGVAICWWFLEFTDLFPAIGGLLGLTGIFAWVAFLTNLVTEDRKKQLQSDLESKILLRPHTATYALLVLLGFGLFALTQGSIVVIGAPDGPKKTVEVRDGGTLVDTFNVPAGATVKRTFLVREGSLTVKPAGLPERWVSLNSFDRERLSLPYSFTTQQAVIAHLPSGLTGSAKHARVKIFIRRKGSEKWARYGSLPHADYNGQSFWIGTGWDVDVPEHVRARWKDEPQNVLARWLTPRAVHAAEPLQPGDTVRVCVMNKEDPWKATLASGEAQVADVRQQRFPQLLELEEHAEVPAGRCP